MVEDDACAIFAVVENGVSVHAFVLHAVIQQHLRDMPGKDPLPAARDPKVAILVAPDHVPIVTTDGFPGFASEKRTIAHTIALAKRAKIVLGRLHNLLDCTE